MLAHKRSCLGDDAPVDVSWELLAQRADFVDSSLLQSNLRTTVSALQSSAGGLGTAGAALSGPPALEASTAMSDQTSALAGVTSTLTDHALMWLVMVTLSGMLLTCIFYAVRHFEQRAASSLPLGSRRKTGGAGGGRLHVQDWSSDEMAPPVPSRACSTPKGSLRRLSPQEAAGQKSGGTTFRAPVRTLLEVAEKGGLAITDTAGALTLRVVVPQSDNAASKIQLFLGEDLRSQCASVESGPDCLNLYGPNWLHFGNLAPQRDGSFVVSAQAHPQLIIDGSEVDMNLRITVQGGRLAAAVSCNSDHPNGEDEYLKISVLPGTDPVLIVACVFAILFLCGDIDADPA
jgi:hypothetical protein